MAGRAWVSGPAGRSGGWSEEEEEEEGPASGSFTGGRGPLAHPELVLGALVVIPTVVLEFTTVFLLMVVGFPGVPVLHEATRSIHGRT